MADIGTGAVSVLVIDDHRMFAESLARLLTDDQRVEVVGVASTGREGIDLVRRLRPRVVLVDFQLPDLNGAEIAGEVRAQHTGSVVVMLTGLTEDRVLLAAIDAGCAGFITKDRAADVVADAVVAAAAGEALITPAQLARLLPKLSSSRGATAAELTARERELLVCMSAGMSNKAIAAELHLSLNTVRNYVQSTISKLGAHSKLEAVATAVRQGIIGYPGRDEPREPR